MPNERTLRAKSKTTHMPDDTRYRDEEWLREQYIEKEKTMQEIADECGCCRLTISRWIRVNGMEGGAGPMEQKYSDEEMLEWIDVFVAYFGVAPSDPDFRDWPGPSSGAYEQRFGSVPAAVSEAGYEPRGETEV
jgi:hypothetical protein